MSRARLSDRMTAQVSVERRDWMGVDGDLVGEGIGDGSIGV